MNWAIKAGFTGEALAQGALPASGMTEVAAAEVADPRDYMRSRSEHGGHGIASDDWFHLKDRLSNARDQLRGETGARLARPLSRRCGPERQQGACPAGPSAASRCWTASTCPARVRRARGGAWIH